MKEVILKVHFPLGTLPVRGFACQACGEEVFLGSDAAEAQDLAHRLGLFGLENKRSRKLRRTGNSLAVTLDSDLVKQVLGPAAEGKSVFVGSQGKRIVIEAADA